MAMKYLKNRPVLQLVLWLVVVFGLGLSVAWVLAQVFPNGV